GTVCHAVHHVIVPAQYVGHAAAGDIHPVRVLVVARRHKIIAVGTERHAPDHFRLPCPFLERTIRAGTGSQVPDAHRVVGTGGGDLLPGGAKGDAVDGRGVPAQGVQNRTRLRIPHYRSPVLAACDNPFAV